MKIMQNCKHVKLSLMFRPYSWVLKARESINKVEKHKTYQIQSTSHLGKMGEMVVHINNLLSNAFYFFRKRNWVLYITQWQVTIWTNIIAHIHPHIHPVLLMFILYACSSCNIYANQTFAWRKTESLDLKKSLMPFRSKHEMFQFCQDYMT